MTPQRGDTPAFRAAMTDPNRSGWFRYWLMLAWERRPRADALKDALALQNALDPTTPMLHMIPARTPLRPITALAPSSASSSRRGRFAQTSRASDPNPMTRLSKLELASCTSSVIAPVHKKMPIAARG